jgi:hypothetical protein
MAKSNILANLEEAQLRADEPRRPLDWRYKRATVLSRESPISRKRKIRPTDDDIISQYADLLWRLDVQSSFQELEKIRKRHPDLLRVHLAYATLNETELAISDGLLLSRSTDPVLIARQSGMNDAQQKLYRQMFLDIDDRRDMSMFISMQLLEPARLRGTLQNGETSTHPEEGAVVPKTRVGTLPPGVLGTIRVIGFYSSPVVLEVIYTGLLMGAIPEGRDSAIRFLTQAQLMDFRRKGLLASRYMGFEQRTIMDLLKFSFDLAETEREEGQIDIIQNIETMFTDIRQRIGTPDKILDVDKLPPEMFSSPVEATESELVNAHITGNIPANIQAFMEAAVNIPQ